MKWSQAICASILVDEFYLLSLHARSNSRSGREVPSAPLEPAFRPNLFKADWGLPRRSPKPQADESRSSGCRRGLFFKSQSSEREA